jgi:hypothetical protein
MIKRLQVAIASLPVNVELLVDVLNENQMPIDFARQLMEDDLAGRIAIEDRPARKNKLLRIGPTSKDQSDPLYLSLNRCRSEIEDLAVFRSNMINLKRSIKCYLYIGKRIIGGQRNTQALIAQIKYNETLIKSAVEKYNAVVADLAMNGAEDVCNLTEGEVKDFKSKFWEHSPICEDAALGRRVSTAYLRVQRSIEEIWLLLQEIERYRTHLTSDAEYLSSYISDINTSTTDMYLSNWKVDKYSLVSITVHVRQKVDQLYANLDNCTLANVSPIYLAASTTDIHAAISQCIRRNNFSGDNNFKRTTDNRI